MEILRSFEEDDFAFYRCRSQVFCRLARVQALLESLSALIISRQEPLWTRPVGHNYQFIGDSECSPERRAVGLHARANIIRHLAKNDTLSGCIDVAQSVKGKMQGPEWSLGTVGYDQWTTRDLVRA